MEGHGGIVRPARRRIAHVAMARVRGGLMRAVETLAAEQARAHDVLVLTPLPPRPAAAAPRPAWRALRIAGNADLGGHRALLRALRTARPDAVILHAGSPGELALAAFLAARRSPTVIVEHAPSTYPLRKPWRDALFRRLKARSRLHVCVSDAGARALEALWGLASGSLRTIHSGVTPPAAPPPGPSPAGGTAAALVVGFGAASPQKGFDTFAAVAGALAAGPGPPRMVWVGGPAAACGGPFETLPWQDDIGPLLAACAVVLLPSRAEGLPLTLLEAMAHGRAIVASAVGGVPEAVRDGAEAVLLPAEDVAAWTATLAALLGDPDRRAALGRAARARWEREFTAAAMAARWEALLEAVWG